MGELQVASPVLALGLGSVDLSLPRPDSAQDSLAGLPSGYPSRLCHSSAWNGADFVEEASYVLHLSTAEKAELLRAKDDFKGAYSLELTSQSRFILTSFLFPSPRA